MGGAGGGAGGGEVMYTSGSEDIYQSIVLSEDTGRDRGHWQQFPCMRCPGH